MTNRDINKIHRLIQLILLNHEIKQMQLNLKLSLTLLNEEITNEQDKK